MCVLEKKVLQSDRMFQEIVSDQVNYRGGFFYFFELLHYYYCLCFLDYFRFYFCSFGDGDGDEVVRE